MLKRIQAFIERLWQRHKYKVFVPSLIVLFVFVFFYPDIFYEIDSGEAGVKWSRFLGGTDLGPPYGEGLQAILPWDKMYIYNTRFQDMRDTTNLLTVNGLTLTVRWSLRYRVNPDSLGVLHKRAGPDYAENIIHPLAISALRRVIGNYTPDEIYARDEEGLLAEIEARVDTHLVQRYRDYILIEDVVLTGLDLPEAVQQSIATKLVNEQEALAYEFRLQREAQERSRKQIEAEGIQLFEQISGIPILQWRGIEATVELAKSPNAKVIVIGTDSNGLPIILNAGQ